MLFKNLKTCVFQSNFPVLFCNMLHYHIHKWVMSFLQPVCSMSVLAHMLLDLHLRC